MNEQQRDPARWLESGALSEELASELSAYAHVAPSAASKARMLEQLSTQVEIVPPVQSVGLGKLTLAIAAPIVVAGILLLMQLLQPEAARVPASDVVHDARERHASFADLAPEKEAPPEVAVVTPRVVRQAPVVPELVPGVVPEVVMDAPEPAPVAKPDVLTELAMLARARRALLNDPARALALSEEHARSYAKGTFVEEREVLAIESLLKLGRKDEARARVVTFAANFPRSAQIAHLAKMIAKPEPSTPE